MNDNNNNNKHQHSQNKAEQQINVPAQNHADRLELNCHAMLHLIFECRATLQHRSWHLSIFMYFY